MEKWTINHPKEHVTGHPSWCVFTRAQLRKRNAILNVEHEFCKFHVFISKIETKTVKIVLEHPDWVTTIQSLAEFEQNKVWRLIPTVENISVVAQLEHVRIFHAYDAHKSFSVYQMDVKCAFLNGELKEKIYVEHPLSFVNDKFPNHFYILDKVVYGLK